MNDWERRERFLRTVHLKGDGAIPSRVSILAPIWDSDPEFFADIKKKSPHVSVGVSRNVEREKENFRRDEWGCLWHYPGDYLDGQVVEHPLESWDSLKNFVPPDPSKNRNWEEVKKGIEKAKKEGKIATAGVEHGFFYLRLTYLRGFSNLMIDIALEEPHLKELIDMVTEYWCEVVRRLVELGVDIVYFGDDLGHQNALPMKPSSWRKLIKPSYQRIFSICRENKVEVYLHTDGYIVDIIPDLIEAGVTILNPQDLVNGLENLQRLVKGKACIDLDIDRQKITAFGKPEDIDLHIHTCIEKLGSPQGGLMLIYGAYPGTPKENIAQVIISMEKYHNFWV